jgi:hypothetical protein
MLNMINYLQQFKPSIDRGNSKYYSEMQQLAYNLVKYLSMNEDKNESNFQGNYNLTYLEENMTNEDFKMIANSFLRRIPIGEVKIMIKDYWPDQTANIVLNNDEELVNKYNDLTIEYNELKEKYNDLIESLKESLENLIAIENLLKTVIAEYGVKIEV